MHSDNELLTLGKLTPVQLAEFVNQLIEKDFSRLVQILYRLDVSEEKLKWVLTENPSTDAAPLIARLLLDRMEQGRRTRETFRSGEEIPEDEKW